MIAKKYCLVLGGGGAKGSYQIGVWQALKKLNIKIDAIIGTSVGALNGLLMIQDDLQKAKDLWLNLSITDILDMPKKYVNQETLEINWRKAKKLLILHPFGLSIGPLKNMMNKNIDEALIRKTKIDYGLTTLNKKTRKVKEMFLEDIPEGKLVSYLLASTALPIFKKVTIDQDVYLDGGLYNNVPIDTAMRRGYKNIIAIDISGLGIHKPIKHYNTSIIYIRNSVSIGKKLTSTLEFTPAFLKQFQYLGYLDTLRVFGKLEGLYYFYLGSKKFIKKFRKTVDINVLKKYLPEEFRIHKDIVRIFIERIALQLEIPQIELYDFKNLLDKIYSIGINREMTNPKTDFLLEYFLTCYETIVSNKENQENLKNISNFLTSPS